MRVLFASAFLLVVGCGSGSGTWRAVVTPHFVLRTDLSKDDARHAGLALEATRDALVSAAWPNFPFKKSEMAAVYVLANGMDFEKYFGRLTEGLFINGEPPTFFLYGTANRWELRRSSHQPTPSVLRHEMVHLLAEQVYSRQPPWFAEGLAQYFETVYYSEDQKAVVFGGYNSEAYRAYKSVRQVTLRDMLEWNRSKGLASMAEREATGLYGTSWFFVHWLVNTHTASFGRYLRELSVGTDPKRAFEIALPSFDPDKAERELFEYQKHGQFSEATMPLVSTQLTDDSIKERLLDAEEVKAVRAELNEASRLHSRKPPKESSSKLSGG